MGCCTIKTAEPVFWKSPCLRTRQSAVIGHTYVDLAQGTIGVHCRSVGQDRLDIPKIHADRDRPRALGCTRCTYAFSFRFARLRRCLGAFALSIDRG
jgi:hypothetical protein